MNGPIVIVDDSEAAPELIKLVLERSGIGNILTYNCPLKVLSDIRNGLRPSLVISDYRMPNMNGTELLTALARVQPQMRGIIMTGDPGSVSRLPRGCVVVEKGRPAFFKELIGLVGAVKRYTDTAGQPPSSWKGPEQPLPTRRGQVLARTTPAR